MKLKISLGLICFNLLVIIQVVSQREVIDINYDWRFTLEDDPSYADPEIETSSWATINVPHDWAHEKGISRNGAQGGNGGYYDGGVGWYQKKFLLPAREDRLVYIDFDGVYMNSEVWINGHYVSKRPYGYISFRYEISAYLKEGENIIAVRVDNAKEPSARWYHPCGIYAPVHLVLTDKLAIKPHGVFVTTPMITDEEAIVEVETSLYNSEHATVKAFVETIIVDADDRAVTTQRNEVEGNEESLVINQSLKMSKPQLWSPHSPYLYKVISRLLVQDRIVDEVETSLGVRTIEWNTDKGFLLNGEITKLLGVSEHYEGGPVGGAWSKPLLRWKLALLKEMGVNAIRTAHNPAPPMFYDLCDELGLLVMDEIFDGWKRKAKQDYGKQAFDQWWQRDMTEWLLRNRNHPSIIIYSVGNETRGEIAKDLVSLCHQLDPTRPVTSGHSASEYMDVYGVNGGSEKQGFFNKPRLDKPFVSTEAPHTWQTRGYYRTKSWFRDGYPNERQEPFDLPDLTDEEVFQYEWASSDDWVNGKQHFNSSYDNAMVRISARKNWELMRDLPWFSGHFRWTGFDYYGEATYVHGGWPFRLFMGGALDVAGFKKDLFYFYKSQWTTDPMAHILPHWTHPQLEKGTDVPVWVYSNCDEVELFLNGVSLGRDIPGSKWDEMQCQWMVPWEPGDLLAKGYIDGKEVAVSKQTTANAPALLELKLETDHIRPQDKITIVTSELLDDKGDYYPYGENKIYYHFDDDVRLLSLENGDPVDTTLNVGIREKKAFMGSSRAFLQLPDNVTNSVLYAGAILGEKQLLSSQMVSIDVKTLNLSGVTVGEQQAFGIYYTVDGSIPTLESTIYQGAFQVELGTTVSAIVVHNGEVILEMKEVFDNGLGLHWHIESTTPVYSNMMSAVDADFSGGKIVEDEDVRYLNFENQEGKVRWYQENDGSAGEFILKFKYAANHSTLMRLLINSEYVGDVDFNATNHQNTKWKEIEIRQSLEAGANYIELQTAGESGPNILGLIVE